MKKKIIATTTLFSWISISVIAIICCNNQNLHANLTEQCELGIPVYPKSIRTGNINDLPIYITAKNVVIKYPNIIKCNGAVDIQYGNQNITADEIKLMQTKNTNNEYTIIAIGNVHCTNPQIILKGQKALLIIKNNKDIDIDIENCEYFLVGRQGHGYAKKIKFRNGSSSSSTILEHGMFTICLPYDKSWSVIGSKIILDSENQIAKIWNARFNIANIPVFFTPYLHLPIGNNHCLPLPNIKFSNRLGINLELPFYWHIKNKNHTNISITPQFISFRGLKLNNEIRYLNLAGRGLIALDWLRHDKKYLKDKKSNFTYPPYPRNSNDRWLFCFRHSGVLNQVWRFNLDYTKVSDNKYFSDFVSNYKSKYGKTLDIDKYSYTKKISFGYWQPSGIAIFNYKNFQNFLDQNKDLKKIVKNEPQLDFNCYKYNIGPFNLKTHGKIYRSRIAAANMNTDNSNQNKVICVHIIPELNLPLSNNLLHLNNSIKVRGTYYYSTPSIKNKYQPHKYMNRLFPSITSDAQFIFKRKLASNYVQTFEPRIQYFYMQSIPYPYPYSNKIHINEINPSLFFYSEGENNLSVRNSIYRYRNNSELKFISSVNQLRTDLTTRIYYPKLIEKLHFSIGQISSLFHNLTEDSNLFLNSKSNIHSLILLSDIYFQPTAQWILSGGLRYDNHMLRGSNTLIKGNIITEYRPESDRSVQLNYRFINSHYINAAIKNTQSPSLSLQNKNKISQLGIILNWQLNNKFGLVGSYYYDMKEKKSINKSIGLKYSTCCWSININYKNNIINYQPQQSISKDSDLWSINIELKGFNKKTNNLELINKAKPNHKLINDIEFYDINC